MYARVATFESDPANLDDAIAWSEPRSSPVTRRPDSRAQDADAQGLTRACVADIAGSRGAV
jgi:hypothetical protein